MRKSAALLSGVLLTSLLFTACSNEAAQESTSAAGTGSAQRPAALTSLFKAPDLSKLPATAQQRTNTIIMALTDPSGAFTPYFHQSGYDGNVSSLMFAPLVTTDDKGLPEQDSNL